MPTVLGLVVLPLTLLWSGRPERLVQLGIVCSVFEAGAAASLGGFGVPVGMVPALALLGHVGGQYLLGMRYPGEAAALRSVLPLLLLLAYALVATLLLPDAFAGRVIVFPQKIDPVATGPVPLAPGTGNLTQVAYLLINVLLTAAAAAMLTRRQIDWTGLLRAYLASGYLVFALSIWNFAARVAGVPFPSNILYSNPGWAIVEQSLGPVPRIQGPFPEPSSLGTYMSGVAFCALWLCVRQHDVMKPHILLGLAVLTVLLSTSTTGIATLALGLPVVLLYAMGRVDAGRLRRAALMLGALLLSGLVALGPIVVMQPELLDSVDIVLDETLSKRESDSFNERSEMNSLALDAAAASWGLGIGWGSTRTSSLLPGILAGAGVFGLAMVVWLFLRVGRLVRRTNALPEHPAHAVLDGFSAALCGQLLATTLSAPTVTSVAFYLQIAAVVAGSIRIRMEAAGPYRRRESGSGSPGLCATNANPL